MYFDTKKWKIGALIAQCVYNISKIEPDEAEYIIKLRNNDEVKTQQLATEYGLAPKIIEFGDEYIIMEKINGFTFARLLPLYVRQHKFEQLNSIVCNIVLANQKLIELGISHGDLHSSNILIDPAQNDRIYIIDYEPVFRLQNTTAREGVQELYEEIQEFMNDLQFEIQTRGVGLKYKMLQQILLNMNTFAES